MKRYDKIFYLVEAVIVAVFVAICYLVSLEGFEIKAFWVIILSLLLTVLSSTLNLVVLTLQKTKQ